MLHVPSFYQLYLAFSSFYGWKLEESKTKKNIQPLEGKYSLKKRYFVFVFLFFLFI